VAGKSFEAAFCVAGLYLWREALLRCAMRLRKRELKPKAVVTPIHGRGPGTVFAEGSPMISWIVSPVSARVQVASVPDDGSPRLARLRFLKMAPLTIGSPDT
jgi:hypothetical protein